MAAVLETAASSAAALKASGNTQFGLGTREGYLSAANYYREASALDPQNSVLLGNLAAAQIEIARGEWDSAGKVEALAKALEAAIECTTLAPSWPKGWIRRANAEFELVEARKEWEKQKVRDREREAKQEKEKAEKKSKSDHLEGVDEVSEDVTTVVEDVQDGDEDDDEDEHEDEEPPSVSGFQPRETKIVPPELLASISAASLVACEASCRAGLAVGDELTPTLVTQLLSRLQALRDGGHVTEEAKDRLLVDAYDGLEASKNPKAAGDAAFKQKSYKTAVAKYTDALARDPFNHVLYSNRSACHAALDELGPAEAALRDAEQCVKLAPGFAKGFGRQSTALYMLGRYIEAEAAARSGLAVDDENAALKEALERAVVETGESEAVQKQMHTFRQEKKQNEKLKAMLSGMNLGGGPGGSGFNVFNGSGMSGGLESILGGMNGGNGFGGKSSMSEAQMRSMARAMEAK
jgi:tetratricopeptide (TPR) repeat protein